MVTDVFNKFVTLVAHHQVIATAMIALGVIVFSWGFENMLHRFLFPKRPLVGYFVAILIGLLLVWTTQHYIYHVSL